ncbi:sorting and assembly machinery component 50 [Anaeramoeba ignava]|uniref:Sorting and assembly machinery component 50 n=1 Tax=Anaeramoeba ignava TaxID=1746090 RepID=A0A9Q0LQC2_ANAIG|nr:sorting and assembly machinery component 50 [Anaeramoeba ignava]
MNQQKFFDQPLKILAIKIIGLKNTKKDIIEKNFNKFQQVKTVGDAFYITEEIFTKLKNLSIFKSIKFNLDKAIVKDNSNANLSVLDVEFEEKSRGPNLQISGNFSKKGFGGSISSKIINMFGRGEKLHGNFSIGKDSRNLLFDFSKPILSIFEEKIPTINFQAFHNINPNEKLNFKEKIIGSQIIMSSDIINPELDNTRRGIGFSNLLHSLSFVCESRSVKTLKENSVDETNQKYLGHSWKTSLVHDLYLDRRDNHLFPSKGYYFHVSNEIATTFANQTSSFIKSTIQTQKNFPIYKSLRLNILNSFGFILPLFSSQEIKINDLFPEHTRSFCRGFKLNENPDSKNFGGNIYNFLSAILSFKLPIPNSEKVPIYPQLFTSIGNIQFKESLQFSNFFQFFHQLLKLSDSVLGFGLATQLGASRLEINASYPIITKEKEKKEFSKISFSFDLHLN